MTYLPFDSVKSLCQSNSQVHSYCTDPRYANTWRKLIDDAFSGVEDYQEKLKPLLVKYGGYNYLVYVNLVKTLDRVSQAMIYYRQGDLTRFNEINTPEKFLLGEKAEMKKLLHRVPGFVTFIDFLEGKNVDRDFLLATMATHGSMTGVKYFLSRGADINGSKFRDTVERAVFQDKLDMVKFLIKNGAVVTPRALDLAEGEISDYLQSIK